MTLDLVLALALGLVTLAFAVWGFLRLPSRGEVKADPASAGVRNPVKAMPEIFGTGGPDFGPLPPAGELEPEAHRESVDD